MCLLIYTGSNFVFPQFAASFPEYFDRMVLIEGLPVQIYAVSPQHDACVHIMHIMMFGWTKARNCLMY